MKVIDLEFWILFVCAIRFFNAITNILLQNLKLKIQISFKFDLKNANHFLIRFIGMDSKCDTLDTIINFYSFLLHNSMALFW
jgi:hypothetical protein